MCNLFEILFIGSIINKTKYDLTVEYKFKFQKMLLNMKI